jgi:hypothetical protein
MATATKSVELPLSAAAALRECQRAAAMMSLAVLKQTDRELTCKEVYTKINTFSGSPMKQATFIVTLTPSASRTVVTVTAELFGLVSKHLQELVGIYCNNLLAGSPPDAPKDTAASRDQSVVERLERLASLHAGGALTDVEFQAAKERLLRGE